MTFAQKTFDPTATGPLTGIRVLDLSRLMAGNMLSLQLADFGADVIKIEPPEGDPLRDWKDDGHSLFWKTYGRNKRSVMLNLRQKQAMAALWALVETADVFIENFRPGTLEKMGLAPEKLLERNPDLIVVRISGFGQTGPYAHLPGFGTIVEAMSGFADRTGFPDREPVLPPLALADMIAGIYGASSTMMALYARQVGTARGQVIDLSLLEPMFSVLGPEAAIHAVTGKVKQRVGSASNTASPRNVYQCADGKYLALSGSTPAVAKRIFEIIGCPAMNDDPRFATNSDRVKNRALVDEAIGGWFATRDSADALATMRAAGATVGPVYNIADAMDDAHFQEREIIVDAADDRFGTLPMHNIVPRLSATPGQWRLPAPELGEHTDTVLREAGLDPETLAGEDG
ncbi:CoA transferase [Devosia sp. 63-57]|uniref:CaiB/BaiF CoA transferase family protein n=1 Tax=Devosia sp. 63-57 TaxID=1895751 RepID=UPI000868BB0D|nr:CoA transferase [Devosia sp. 63-57]ODT47184.1 MAG: acyl-CoA transferase [Pelagibacterium sp. SCN 63-126]ODU88998.1 MAG: acyl-CoA transferase [Pelagibacterium sp. SCN 63-17]OJX43105.1 MAG: CoA transferase [Devosia sp. 63-57]